MNKKIIVAVVLGIVIIIAVVALTAEIVSWKFAKKSPAPAETKTTAQSVSQNKVTDETTDWQTYRNEKYGFEFQYPYGYEVVYSPADLDTFYVKNKKMIQEFLELF